MTLENTRNSKIDVISWAEVSKKLFDIINNFKQRSSSIDEQLN